MITKPLFELRSEMQERRRMMNYQIFVSDFMCYLLEETTKTALYNELSMSDESIVINMHMEAEYIKYGTSREAGVHLIDALKMIAYICEHYNIEMEIIEGYNVCYKVPIELVLGNKEFETDLIESITK